MKPREIFEDRETMNKLFTLGVSRVGVGGTSTVAARKGESLIIVKSPGVFRTQIDLLLLGCGLSIYQYEVMSFEGEG